MHSTICTALHAQPCLDSTTCTALLGQHYMHSTTLVLVRDVLCSYFACGCALTGLSPKMYVCICMRACMQLLFGWTDNGVQNRITYRQTDQQIDRQINKGGTLLFPTPTITTVSTLTAAISSATTPDLTCLSRCLSVNPFSRPSVGPPACPSVTGCLK